MIAPTRPNHSEPEYAITPYTVIIDSREQHPYLFRGFKSDAKSKGVPLIIQTAVCGLKSGDYSIAGLESEVAVERKSLEDLYSTISQRRPQFEAEMIRLAEMKCAAVVIEASLNDIVKNPPPQSRILPKVIYRTWVSWQHRYKIPWHLCETRQLAEITTFRILNWYWEERLRTSGKPQ